MNCEAVGMCLQAGAVMNAETSDLLFNRRDLKVLSEDHVGKYHGASAIMRRALDWKRSRISILEVEAYPQSCIRLRAPGAMSIFLYASPPKHHSSRGCGVGAFHGTSHRLPKPVSKQQLVNQNYRGNQQS
jgi:hypothetical protein